MNGHVWEEQDYCSYTVKSPRFRCKKCGASSGVTDDMPSDGIKVINDFYGLVIAPRIERYKNGEPIPTFTCEEAVLHAVMEH